MRKKPYSERGIRRVPCARCGTPSSTQWQVCADGNQYRGLCIECDIQLNKLVLGWMGLPFDEAAYRSTLTSANEEKD